jgi:23S rRNA pseudouridine1911/1915/1917 synthase
VSVRLDRRLRAQHPELSWTRIREAIARGQVLVNEAVERDAAREVDAAAVVTYDPNRPSLPHARLDLPRLYEDDEILVIDKPAGLLTIATDPSVRHSEDTVLRRAQEYARHLHGRHGYAGVLHRLDRDTSGALAIALSREAHARGRELFAAHEFERRYLAIVQGVPDPPRGTIDAAVSREYVSGRRRIARREDEGRHAVTHYRVLEPLRHAALVELRLETGRQHQIRLHLRQLGHPLVGERTYADAPDTRAPRQMLHAWRLEFPHPLRRQTIAVEAPPPADFEKMLRTLR